MRVITLQTSRKIPKNMLQNKYCKTQYGSSFLIKILNISILPDDRIFSTLHEMANQGTGGPLYFSRNILINSDKVYFNIQKPLNL